ncbi:hypothetical protein F2Q69_00029013 [Brassica cretica]|uniref:Uncharacterized protein n=1 Tax=Brassica cretica TaxID=69181 RepID=A0A8S9RTX6_BRACR|nr:hypothetical protein F2Q69_00029013 [Brassica cretica]
MINPLPDSSQEMINLSWRLLMACKIDVPNGFYRLKEASVCKDNVTSVSPRFKLRLMVKDDTREAKLVLLKTCVSRHGGMARGLISESGKNGNPITLYGFSHYAKGANRCNIVKHDAELEVRAINAKLELLDHIIAKSVPKFDKENLESELCFAEAKMADVMVPYIDWYKLGEPHMYD